MSRRKPPQILERILSRILPRYVDDSALGDFEEEFISIASKRTRFLANFWYLLQIFKSIPSFLIETIRWGWVMFQNSMIVAIRNIRKNKINSFINIFGLAIGMAVCLLLLLYVQDESSYDRFHAKADRIYRVANFTAMGDVEDELNGASALLAPALIQDFPEVEDAVRFRRISSVKLQFGDKIFRERRIVFSEPSFFNIFSFPLIKGDSNSALESPHSVILSAKTAKKYFDKADPIGETISMNDSEDYKVTGVFQDIPQNSHFHFDVIGSLSSLDDFKEPSWLMPNFPTYLLLKDGTRASSFQEKLPAVVEKYTGPAIKEVFGKTLDELGRERGWRAGYFLQPLTSIHLNSDISNEFEANGDARYITLFSTIALIILVLAAINFMNLCTAYSSVRAKEVGIRKVLGSHRWNLFKQFITESVLMCVVSLAFALVIVILALPLLNSLAGKGMSFSSLGSGFMLLSILLVTLLVGFLAGSYPALFISSFPSAHVLAGRFNLGGKSTLLRRGLVVFQFFTSIILLVGTLIILFQLRYIQNKNLGFNKEQVLVVDGREDQFENAHAFKNEMQNYPQIINSSVSGFLPVPSRRRVQPVYPQGAADKEKWPPINIWHVDHDYIKTFEMKVVAGRDFSVDSMSNTEVVIINQKAAEHFGWEHALGKVLYHSLEPGRYNAYTVIGVVEDFHFDSLRDSIKPLVLVQGNNSEYISFRIKTEDLSRTLATFEKRWEEFYPQEPFVYAFLDEKFNHMYRSDLRIGNILSVFTALAVFIGCLGLFGLAAFTTERRTKEIGIRKVLGESVQSIIKMLLKEYVLLVCIANVIAWPVVYYVMRNWLQGFAYRLPISISVFLIAGAGTLVLAVTTVIYHAGKAAISDPIKSLRYE